MNNKLIGKCRSNCAKHSRQRVPTIVDLRHQAVPFFGVLGAKGGQDTLGPVAV